MIRPRLKSGFMNACLPIATAVILLIGCATVKTVNYRDLILNINAHGTRGIAVAVIDLRKDVVSKLKSPDAVGAVKSATLEWSDIKTLSGKPLADDLSFAVRKSLERKGFKTVPVEMPAVTDVAAVENLLKKENADRLILLIVNQLWSETYASTQFEHNLKLLVMDQSGKVVATVETKGSNKLGDSNQPDKVQGNLEVFVFMKLLELLNDDVVRRSLSE